MFDFEIEDETGAIARPLVRIDNCDKDGSIVAARLASAMGGISAGRSMALTVDREAGCGYFADLAGRVLDLYRRVGGMGEGNPLLDPRTVVMGSVHRLGLYLAEVLHAPFLPLQFLGFASGWEQAAHVDVTAIAGADFDVPLIWLWLKPTRPAHFPDVYTDALREAEYLVLVRSTDSDADCPIIGHAGHVHINATIQRIPGARGFWDQIPESDRKRPSDADSLRQWEWGLPDATIELAKAVWARLGKPATKCITIEGSTNDLYAAITPLWEHYLAKNAIPVRGFTLNGYWIAHPEYERAAGLLPIHFYDFHPAARQIAAAMERHKELLSCLQPETCCAFLTTAAGAETPDLAAEFLRARGLAERAWFSVGFDAVDAGCRDVFGESIPPPHRMIANWMASAPASIDRNSLRPLNFSEATEALPLSVRARISGTNG